MLNRKSTTFEIFCHTQKIEKPRKINVMQNVARLRGTGLC